MLDFVAAVQSSASCFARCFCNLSSASDRGRRMTLLLSLLCVVVVVGSIIAVDGASGIPCPSGFFSCLAIVVGGREGID